MAKKFIKNPFELQLVVIGTLIVTYLEALPYLLSAFSNSTLSLMLPKILFYGLGSLWFICLLFGTYTLIPEKDNYTEWSSKAYAFLFKWNNRITPMIFGGLIVIYLALLVSTYLPILNLNIVSLIIAVLSLIISFILSRGDKNVKNRKK